MAVVFARVFANELLIKPELGSRCKCDARERPRAYSRIRQAVALARVIVHNNYNRKWKIRQ